MKDLVHGRGLDSEFAISSAAVSYEEEGNGIYPPAAAVLRRNGVGGFSVHRAHRITAEEFAAADLVVIMDSSNRRLMSRIVGEENMDKVHKLMTYCGSDRDVSDPWYTGDFDLAYNDIFAGCKALLAALTESNEL